MKFMRARTMNKNKLKKKKERKNSVQNKRKKKEEQLITSELFVGFKKSSGIKNCHDCSIESLARKANKKMPTSANCKVVWHPLAMCIVPKSPISAAEKLHSQQGSEKKPEVNFHSIEAIIRELTSPSAGFSFDSSPLKSSSPT